MRWIVAAVAAVEVVAVSCRGAPSAAPPAPPPASAAEAMGTWQVQVVKPHASLRGVAAADDRVVWASGSGGTVLRSTDGGAAWQSVGPPDTAGLDFRDVQAFSAQRAVISVAGPPARIYATDDGGSTWRTTFEDPRAKAFFDAMAFFADGRGLLFGDPIDGALQVFATSDGGGSWRPLPPTALPPPMPGEAAFAASGTCVATLGRDCAWIVTGGAQSRALRSQDGGATWSTHPLPLRQGKDSQGAYSVAFFDADHGVAVGGDYAAPDDTGATVATTADGGRTWALAVAPAVGYRSAVVCLPDGRSCLAVGASGTSRSRDRGATWEAVGREGFHAVAVAGDVAIAVGAEGRIGRLHWRQP